MKSLIVLLSFGILVNDQVANASEGARWFYGIYKTSGSMYNWGMKIDENGQDPLSALWLMFAQASSRSASLEVSVKGNDHYDTSYTITRTTTHPQLPWFTRYNADLEFLTSTPHKMPWPSLLEPVSKIEIQYFNEQNRFITRLELNAMEQPLDSQDLAALFQLSSRFREDAPQALREEVRLVRAELIAYLQDHPGAAIIDKIYVHLPRYKTRQIGEIDHTAYLKRMRYPFVDLTAAYNPWIPREKKKACLRLFEG